MMNYGHKVLAGVGGGRIVGVVMGVAVGLCVCLAGCSKEEPAGEAMNAVAEGGAVVHSYALRGRIVSLPVAADPASELRIRHEAIDDFKMGDGEAAPMKSMTMPFSPGPGESLEGLAVGDAIEFVFEMQWEPGHEMRAVSVKKLPAETVLGFEAVGE
jgi:copper binding protein CusF